MSSRDGTRWRTLRRPGLLCSSNPIRPPQRDRTRGRRPEKEGILTLSC